MPIIDIEVFDKLIERARFIQPQMVSWRREIHKRPELGFQEYQTAALVSRVLEEMGIETRKGVAKTGVVGQIFGGDGQLVGLRADMDALPIEEVNGSEFDSLVPGVMHACGHDAHTAMLLGAATLLKELADQGSLPGSVRLLFQPSEEWQDEEGKSGGLRMVEEGALADLNAVFGLHVDPETPAGYASIRPGPILAAADTFKIVIKGSGGHAAYPQAAIDTIAISGLLINAIHHLVSRKLNPLEAGVVTIGTIHGGTVDNIIPDKVVMTGTLRSFSPESRQLLFDELEKVCQMVIPLGGGVEVAIMTGYPPTINDPAATALFAKAAGKVVGADKVVESEIFMGAEDFSFMLQEVPGSYLFLGTHDPEWGDHFCQLHQPNTRVSEKALPYGAAILAASALQWMSEHGLAALTRMAKTHIPAWRKKIQFFVSRPLITRLLTRVVTLLDRPLLDITKGRFCLSAYIAGWPVINLTTIGAKTGKYRTNPIIGLPDGEKIVLIGSNFAREKHPAWFYNLKKTPLAYINGGAQPFKAREAEPEEYDRYWDQAVETHLGFAQYRERSSRKFPIIILEPAASDYELAQLD